MAEGLQCSRATISLFGLKHHCDSRPDEAGAFRCGSSCSEASGCPSFSTLQGFAGTVSTKKEDGKEFLVVNGLPVRVFHEKEGI
eukprot:8824337-Alexandrium_andersonii.AAC.1